MAEPDDNYFTHPSISDRIDATQEIESNEALATPSETADLEATFDSGEPQRETPYAEVTVGTVKFRKIGRAHV